MGAETEDLILFFGWLGVFYLLADGWRWHGAKSCIGPAGMQIALAKSRSVRGASHEPVFMSSCLTISHTFYMPYLPST